MINLIARLAIASTSAYLAHWWADSVRRNATYGYFGWDFEMHLVWMAIASSLFAVLRVDVIFMAAWAMGGLIYLMWREVK